MIVLITLITAVYLLLIVALIFGFNKVKVYTPSSEPVKQKFSILIPFRDESENLAALIQSLQDLNYSKAFFEIILINDNSKDNSVELALRLLGCTQLDFQIYDNVSKSSSPKKDAITLGINKAKYEWIITTDSDCIVPVNWLLNFSSFINKTDAKMIIAPVMLSDSSSIFDQFQTSEILSLQAATMGSFGLQKPLMANGANLCYHKALFMSLNGYAGNNNIASGDDIFLLEKAVKAKYKIDYLKSRSVIVETSPEKTISDVIQQRIRWAAKTSSYSNFFAKFVGLTILLMNALIVCSLILSILGFVAWWYFLGILIVKQVVDYSLINKSAKFFNREKVLNTYFFSSLIYPFVSLYIAVKSIFSTYHWKGRSYKK